MTQSNFHPTRWTLVLRSRGEGEEAKAALSDLCSTYYAPVVAFLRREGRNEDEAREQAHAFFESILTSGLGKPDPERGRFRSYLLGSLKHFIVKQRVSASAAKRGGGLEHIPLTGENDTAPGHPVPGVSDGTLAFDREWALALIARALSALEEENFGRPALFATLKPWLGAGTTGSQASAAVRLGMSQTAVKVAIHRLRVRFRELIRAEIAATVATEDDVADELRHLIDIVTSG